jgi:hypothetical protein
MIVPFLQMIEAGIASDWTKVAEGLRFRRFQHGDGHDGFLIYI